MSKDSAQESRLVRWSRPIAIGMVLMAVLVVGLAVSRAWLRDARRDVVVELEVTEDYEQLFVNCVFVGAVSPEEETRRSFDLGWLSPDDRISVALVDRNQPVADVYYRGIVNGVEQFVFKRGSLAAPGMSVPSQRRYVFERTYTADGDLIGSAGCQRPRFVLTGIEYIRLTGDTMPSHKRRSGNGRLGPASFEPDQSMDRLDIAGHAGLWILAVTGFLLILLLVLRELFWGERWDWKNVVPLGVTVIAGLLTLLDLVSLELAVTVVGLGLYLVVVTVLWTFPSRATRSAGGSGE